MEKAILAALSISCLTGCLGAQLSVPGNNHYVANHQNPPARTWCGMTLWIGIPIPLKLPVCRTRPSPSPLYACGPLMFLGPLVHGYEGNFLCGKFRS
ncbi:hypothetical protein B1R45_07805 [Pseudomonas azotoformans]|nr:hypothetical protein B1R45_07805 [Pseudomonas azotoformans]